MHVNYRYVLRKCRDLCPAAGARILDYGCGAGDVVQAGRAEGLDIWGSELFLASGDRRALVAEKGLLGDAVRELDDGRIPFPDAHFDLVVSNQVFEHVIDLDAVLDEIRRVLQPGGRLLCLFPSRDVWREGHCGVPLAHWWPVGGRARYRWLLAGRRLGLGANKDDKTPAAWAREYADYLDGYTFYRSRAEIRRAFSARFASVRHAEEDYMRFRLAARCGARGTGAVTKPPLRGLVRWACRKLGGLVIVAEKV